MKLYIGNISFNTDDQALSGLFEAYGQVDSAAVITDRDTGRSRGFGFVEMPVKKEALAAMSGLNESEVDGRRLVVNEARARN